MKKFFLLLVLIAFRVSAQSEVDPPFMFNVSPVSNSMGNTGTSLPTADPYGFLLNPSQLGYTSKMNNMSFMYSPLKTITPALVVLWFERFLDFETRGAALNIGYNFKRLTGIPLSVGFGFTNQEMKFSSPEGVRSVFGIWDYYNAYSLGAGVDYGVQFYAGITFKDITSEFTRFAERIVTHTAEGFAIDYGFIVNAPIVKLLDDNFALNLFRGVPDKPYFNFSVGMATANIGDEIYYIDPSLSNPLQRTVRLGYAVSGGLDIYLESIPLNIIDIAFSAEARDILVEIDYSELPFETSYQSGLGDIDISKNILQIEGDEKARSMAGLQLSFLETAVIRSGHSSMHTSRDKSSGFEVRLKGMLKVLDKFTDSSLIEFISNHFDLRYLNATYELYGMKEIKTEGILLVINGFEFR